MSTLNGFYRLQSANIANAYYLSWLWRDVKRSIRILESNDFFFLINRHSVCDFFFSSFFPSVALFSNFLFGIILGSCVSQTIGLLAQYNFDRVEYACVNNGFRSIQTFLVFMNANRCQWKIALHDIMNALLGGHILLLSFFYCYGLCLFFFCG